MRELQRLVVSDTYMKMLAHPGTRRTLTGWGIFIIGLVTLLWLHTFRDQVAHRAILPLLLLLWIALGVLVWDGCKAVRLGTRLALLSVQALLAFLASVLFVQYLIQISL